ncbi:TRAP transporter permease [Marivita sp. S0852]|uniref:TRAP transporter permease n=1 Tax=Marivita sp. S0852 TaxID=3373893 RepID=UPI003981CA65
MPAPKGTQAAAGRLAAGVFSLLVIYNIAVSALDEATARFGAVAIAVLVVALARPASRSGLFYRTPRAGRAADLALVAGLGFAGWWFHKVQADLWSGFFTPTPVTVAAGLTGLAVVLILSIRAWGPALAIMALFAAGFAFAGPHLPPMLAHFGVGLGSFVQITWYSFDGVFGRMTGLVASNLLIFLIFGAVLKQTGAGESLIRMSTALLGRVRGGAAHAAIAASAIFGMMNGSVAANVAGTGIITIPMIRRQGFSARFAGAVETAASSGGQLTPPIMAAAAFVMADLLGLPLLMVLAAATLPVVFKYLGLFAQVYVEAVRQNIQPLPEHEIPVLTRQDRLNSALVIVPLLALMASFLAGMSTGLAGLIGVVTALAMGLLLTPDVRRDPHRIWQALCDGGISSAQIMLSVAVIGIVLAVVNETGVAIRFGIALSHFGETHLFVTLIMAMLGALVLGMGLPTLPAYLVVAIMIAPTLITAGVDPLAAHMFVLYFAVFSSIMPPVAYGCFVAAPIAGTEPLRMSLTALRLSAVGLIVPFMFVYSPSLLLVTHGFSWAELLTTVLRLGVAVWLLATALGGATTRSTRLPLANRLLRGGLACGLVAPLSVIWGPSLLAALCIGLSLAWFRSLRPAPLEQGAPHP